MAARSMVPVARALVSMEVMAANAKDLFLLLNAAGRSRRQRASAWEARIARVGSATIVGAIAAARCDREALW